MVFVMVDVDNSSCAADIFGDAAGEFCRQGEINFDGLAQADALCGFETYAAFGQVYGDAIVRLHGLGRAGGRVFFCYGGVREGAAGVGKFFGEDDETYGHGVRLARNDAAIFVPDRGRLGGWHGLPPQERDNLDVASDSGRGRLRIAPRQDAVNSFTGGVPERVAERAGWVGDGESGERSGNKSCDYGDVTGHSRGARADCVADSSDAGDDFADAG